MLDERERKGECGGQSERERERVGGDRGREKEGERGGGGGIEIGRLPLGGKTSSSPKFLKLSYFFYNSISCAFACFHF